MEPKRVTRGDFLDQIYRKSLKLLFPEKPKISLEDVTLDLTLSTERVLQSSHDASLSFNASALRGGSKGRSSGRAFVINYCCDVRIESNLALSLSYTCLLALLLLWDDTPRRSSLHVAPSP